MSAEHKTVGDCIARVTDMGGSEWTNSESCSIPLADRQCLRKVIMELFQTREKLHDLQEAVSPGRIGRPEYYIGVARRLRGKQVTIRPVAGGPR